MNDSRPSLPAASTPWFRGLFLAASLASAGCVVAAESLVASDTTSPDEETSPDEDTLAPTSAAAVFYGSPSIYGIHFHPEPKDTLPWWLGSGSRRVWVVETVAGGASFDWFHWRPEGQPWTSAVCGGKTFCGELQLYAQQNVELVGRIDDYRHGPYSVPPANDWVALYEWRELIRERLFQSADGTPVTKFARTLILGNEVNICGEAGNPAGCSAEHPALATTPPAWYAAVYREMRGHLREFAKAAGTPDVNVMLQASSPVGYGGARYTHYVLSHLCDAEVDAIALHAYGLKAEPGADGTFGLSSQVTAQLDGIDDACDGKFRGVPVLITEWSRGNVVLPKNLPAALSDKDFVEKVYAWIAAWNADPKHHRLAGATYFHGRGPGFDAENITQDGPNDHGPARQSFAKAVSVGALAQFGAGVSGPLPKTNACSLGASRLFPETGFAISGPIRTFWEKKGGLATYGFPIGPARIETNSSGFTLCSQWFERHRIEVDGKGQITLGRLGAERLEEDYLSVSNQGALAPLAAAPKGCKLVGGQHAICGEFLKVWNQVAATGADPVARFGYPLTEPFLYKTRAGQTFTSQYFERARFELHPEVGGVLFGLLGAERFLDRR